MAMLRVAFGGGSYRVKESEAVVKALLDSRPAAREHDPLPIGRPVTKFTAVGRGGRGYAQYSVEQVHRLPVDELRIRP